MNRETAEAHWNFIEHLLRLENDDGMVGLETVQYLYIEAMLHGATAAPKTPCKDGVRKSD